MNSFIGWIGGKRALRKDIIARFPSTPPARYIEVFGGAGWVLFGKERVSGQLEVFNDINGDLINLYRCIKFHCAELQRELEWFLSSREVFENFRDQLGMRGLTDIQRAARFFYLIKISFGSDHRTFATSSKSTANATLYLTEVQERLRGVTIENRDFAALIKTYDRTDALFYADPPYVDAENSYTDRFPGEDHERLRSILGAVKGHFILSYNDVVSIRELYRDYNIDTVERRQTLSSVGQNKSIYHELIIRNF